VKHNPRRKNLRHFKSALRGFFSFFSQKKILVGLQKIKPAFRDWDVAAWQVQRDANEAEREIRGKSSINTRLKRNLEK